MQIEKQIEINLDNGRDVIVDIQVDGSVDNDGIGSYEYWGAKGFDAGTDYAVMEGFEILSAVFSDNGTPALVDGELYQLIEREVERIKDEISELLMEQVECDREEAAIERWENQREDRHEDW